MTDEPRSDVPDPRLLEPLAQRRSLRTFAPEAPDDASLELLFEAARWAPSLGNAQPWRFVVVRRGGPGWDALVGTLRRMNAWAREAPVLVLTATATILEHPTKPPRPHRLALLDLGLALGGLIVQGQAEGLVVHPLDGFDEAAAAEALGVPPGHDVGVLLAIGHHGSADSAPEEVRAKDARPRTRRTQDTFVFEGRWGAPVAWAETGT